MEEEAKKPHRHLHIGALILVIILIYLLFKVNLEKAVNSPQFNKNVAFIELKGKQLWDYIFNDPLTKLIDQIKNVNIDPKPLNIDQQKLDDKFKSNGIRNYFNAPTNDTINKYSSPTGN